MPRWPPRMRGGSPRAAQPFPEIAAGPRSRVPKAAAVRPLEQTTAWASRVSELDHRVPIERNQNPAKPCEPL